MKDIVRRFCFVCFFQVRRRILAISKPSEWDLLGLISKGSQEVVGAKTVWWVICGTARLLVELYETSPSRELLLMRNVSFS